MIDPPQCVPPKKRIRTCHGQAPFLASTPLMTLLVDVRCTPHAPIKKMLLHKR